MGFSKKHEGLIFELEAKKRGASVGVTFCSSLKPILTKHVSNKNDEDEEEDSTRSTTPTSLESRISSSRYHCPPPAPRKRKTKPMCYYGGVREYFSTPPDLESVFIRRAEKA